MKQKYNVTSRNLTRGNNGGTKANRKVRRNTDLSGTTRACANCPAGKFSYYGKIKCTVCDQGQHANKNTAATDCISCPSGQYGSDAVVAQRINEGDACDKCGIGKYSTNGRSR